MQARCPALPAAIRCIGRFHEATGDSLAAGLSPAVKRQSWPSWLMSAALGEPARMAPAAAGDGLPLPGRAILPVGPAGDRRIASSAIGRPLVPHSWQLPPPARL